jgi:hypothetical protein
LNVKPVSASRDQQALKGLTMLKELSVNFRGYFLSVGIPTSHLIVFSVD